MPNKPHVSVKLLKDWGILSHLNIRSEECLCDEYHIGNFVYSCQMIKLQKYLIGINKSCEICHFLVFSRFLYMWLKVDSVWEEFVLFKRQYSRAINFEPAWN